MIITEQAQRAIDYLRSAPESKRSFSRVMHSDGKMCACAMLAQPLGIHVNHNTYTYEIIQSLSNVMGVPVDILSLVPEMNDCRSYGDRRVIPLYSFAQIANKLQEEISAYEEEDNA